MAESLPDDIKECADFQEWLKYHELDSPGLYTLRTAFTKVLKYYFSDKKNLAAWGDSFGCNLDKFTVQPGAIIDPGNTNHVPGVIVTTGDGISYETPWVDAQIAREPDYATLRNTHIAKVNMTFVCMHYDPDVAAKLSDTVFALLVSAETMFFETWNWLLMYRPTQQTSPQLARKAQEPEAFENYYESRVIVELTFEYGTVTRIESRRMQDYRLTGPLEGDRSVDVGLKVR